MAEFVAEVPSVEIIEGMVHTRLGECEWYWKPATFRAFVECGTRKLDKHDRRTVVRLRPKR